MSFVPATDDRDLWAVLGAIAAGGIVLSWWTRREQADPGTIVAQCADGSVIGLKRDRVRRRPGSSAEQRERSRARYPGATKSELAARLSDDLKPGDLSFARARPGRAGEGPWVVDALDRGRDATSIAWEFGSEDDARRVLQLLNQRTVRPPLDQRGQPIAVGEADLDAVQERERREEESGRAAEAGLAPATG